MKGIGLILAGVLIAADGHAAPMGTNRLDKLAQSASLIVMAQVASGAQSGTTASVILDVRRALKGVVPGAGMLPVELETAPDFAAWRSLAGIQGIWFLAEAGPGKYKVLPVMTGSAPLEYLILPAMLDLPVAWNATAAATPLERVLCELAAVTEKGGTSAIVAALLSQVPATADASLRGLYRQMAASSASAVSITGIAGLVRSNDPSALPLVRQKVSTRAPLEVAASSALARAVCDYSDANAHGLAALADLAGVPQPVPQLQECAAEALRAIHSRETVPYLLKLLDNAAPVIRYEAVAGLASYANSGYIPNEKPYTMDGAPQRREPSPLHSAETESNFPTMDTFQKDELPFIAFWKQWGMQNSR